MNDTTQPRRNTNAIFGAALAAAAVTLAGTLYRTNQRDLTFTLSPFDTFGTALGLAAIPVLVYLLVLIGCGYLGWLRNWLGGLAAGAIGVLLGGVIGYIVQILSGGLPLDGQAWGAIFGEFFGLNFPFVIAGLLAASMLAPAVYRGISGEARPGEPARYASAGASSIDAAGSAFLRIPSQALLDTLDEADRDAANEEWETLVATFEEHGWGTQAIESASTERDSMLVGDTALVLGEQVIPARPKSDERRGELAAVKDALVEAGAVLDELEAPASFNPADVVEREGVLYVGLGATTNAAAVRGLRKVTAHRGYRVIGVPVRAGLHLADIASVLPDGTMLLWSQGVEQPSQLGRFVEAPEQRGAAVVTLDAHTLAVPASAPKTAELLVDLGYDTVTVTMPTLEAAGATLPRLSLRSRD